MENPVLWPIPEHCLPLWFAAVAFLQGFPGSDKMGPTFFQSAIFTDKYRLLMTALQVRARGWKAEAGNSRPDSFQNFVPRHVGGEDVMQSTRYVHQFIHWEDECMQVKSQVCEKEGLEFGKPSNTPIAMGDQNRYCIASVAFGTPGCHPETRAIAAEHRPHQAMAPTQRFRPLCIGSSSFIFRVDIPGAH